MMIGPLSRRLGERSSRISPVKSRSAIHRRFGQRARAGTDALEARFPSRSAPRAVPVNSEGVPKDHYVVMCGRNCRRRLGGTARLSRDPHLRCGRTASFWTTSGGPSWNRRDAGIPTIQPLRRGPNARGCCACSPTSCCEVNYRRLSNRLLRRSVARPGQPFHPLVALGRDPPASGGWPSRRLGRCYGAGAPGSRD